MTKIKKTWGGAPANRFRGKRAQYADRGPSIGPHYESKCGMARTYHCTVDPTHKIK